MSAARPLRVLVADDHPIVRSGLRLVLERDRDLVVAGETADGSEAIAWMDRDPVEIAILDIAMPGMNGIDAAAQILRKHPETAVILLSMHSDETYVLRALRAGARGYVLKESAEGELISAVRAVAAGRSYFSPKVARILQQEHVQQLRRTGAVDTYELLTERERQVLQLVAEGNSNKEIAVRLFLSVYTVETHRKNILQKLNLHGAADLILYAVRKGIL
jgi:two-component system, NarL family, response regulator NreC